uniref:Uncharacterized protein n=1 Tax=Anguilla anguilla TaxID=7936 RepID=A0A0E9Q7W4_ANGAN
MNSVHSFNAGSIKLIYAFNMFMQAVKKMCLCEKA